MDIHTLRAIGQDITGQEEVTKREVMRPEVHTPEKSAVIGLAMQATVWDGWARVVEELGKTITEVTHTLSTFNFWAYITEAQLKINKRNGKLLERSRMRRRGR
jgi:hypothetical protein